MAGVEGKGKKEVSFADSEGDGRKAAMRVITGADGFGSELKDVLIEYMKEKNIEVVDVGVDKYYTVAVQVASQLAKEKKESRDGPLLRGLLVCGTGVGVSIFANKFGGVYAAACNSVEEAVNARSINNTNVLTLGAKIASPEEGKKILDAWLETPFKAPCPASDGRPWNDDIQHFLDASIPEMERVSQPALDNNVPPGKEGGVHDKSMSIAEVARAEKTSDTTISHVHLLQKLLESSRVSAKSPLNEDTAVLESEGRAGVGPGLTPVYATATDVADSQAEERAGVGPGLMAVRAPISQLSTVSTIDVSDFDLEQCTGTANIDTSITEEEESQQQSKDMMPKEAPMYVEEDMKEAAEANPKTNYDCAICALANTRKFENVDLMPGGSWTIMREDPTSAVVRFKAGSLEPAHHHTFGHDLIVKHGTKTVWNLTTGEKFDLGSGDFLYTPAGDIHRVQYHEDTEFFIRWDGHWDILLDEDLEAAKGSIEFGQEPNETRR